jgi:hypothetical protein
LYQPKLHFWHLSCPAFSANLPAAQFLQVMPPVTPLYFPTGQNWQVVWPEALVTEPFSQKTHALLAVSKRLPGAHNGGATEGEGLGDLGEAEGMH